MELTTQRAADAPRSDLVRYAADGRRIPEVLAPAGGREQFFAALNAGADAVYLGLKGFNARARAENFTTDDLRELVPLAHAHGMQVLITVNVLIKDVELADLVRMLGELEEIQVDAIIVQDLGIAGLVKAHFPRLRMHASTQMAVHNLAGVKAAVAMGFRRVVLARELTALEVRKIRAKISRDEAQLEVFCHGSLCYSYSGLCFFSGAEDARSGNRGECAYTCRQPYKIVSEPGQGFLFSMRDLDTSKALDLLVDAGVDTLKIEGRKKDAQYVASTVRLYRERLDEVFGMRTRRSEAPTSLSEGAPPVIEDLAYSFQRQQTSFFLQGRYHENVIDLDSPTHAGVVVGDVEAVAGQRITVRAACALERFDGLRLVPQAKDLVGRYENKHPEFSLREMTVGRRRATESKPGDLVTIELPEDVTAPRVGDVVRKIRSADLKRRVTALAQLPKDARLKAWREVEIALTARPAGDRLLMTARASKFGEALAEVELPVDAMPPKGPADLGRDLAQAFQKFGDHGFVATHVAFEGERDWFVPRSLVKQLKNELAARLPAAYECFVAARIDRAVDAVSGRPAGARRAEREPSYSVKTDRLETLASVAAYRTEHPDFPLAELVFEPKRAFLPDLDPEGLATTLLAIGAKAGVPVRIAMPTVIRAWDEPLLKRWLTAAQTAGLTRLEVGNIGALELINDWGLDGSDLASDFTLYTLNSHTTRHWLANGIKTVCLSIEDDLENLTSHLSRLAPDERAATQAILFKDTPLFIAEACSLTALHNGCPTSKVCGYRSLVVENPAGDRFHVAHESCKSIVYGERAYSITHRQAALMDLGVSRFRIDFLTRAYDDAGISRVLDAVRGGQAVAGTHTANFDRSLL